jgi:crossover junction endodeoxyribonuclease RuvC
MIVLGLDPGTARLGFGVLSMEGSRIVHLAHGCLETPKILPQAARLEDLHRRLGELLARYRPGLIGVEKLYFSRNVRTAMSVSEARGMILLAAQAAGARITEHAPMQVKQAVVGYGGAEKRQVQAMVARILSLETVPEPDDAADALAIAYCAAVTA